MPGMLAALLLAPVILLLDSPEEGGVYGRPVNVSGTTGVRAGAEP